MWLVWTAVTREQAEAARVLITRCSDSQYNVGVLLVQIMWVVSESLSCAKSSQALFDKPILINRNRMNRMILVP